jgi:hypothetical protein
MVHVRKADFLREKNNFIVTSVADLDPGSGAFLTPGCGMNIPAHISESLEKNFFGLKILKFCNADLDPGSGIFSIRDPGSGMKINLDPG